MMTDGHSHLLLLKRRRKTFEVKGTEDHYARSTINSVGKGIAVKGFREPGQRCRSQIGGSDKTARTSPTQSCISGYNREGFHIWRVWLWPRRCGYVPLVPRETDELPFPTDMASLWILAKMKIPSFQNRLNYVYVSFYE